MIRAWNCPGCGAKVRTAAGLSWHLVAEGPRIGQAACPVAQLERYGARSQGAPIRKLEEFGEARA